MQVEKELKQQQQKNNSKPSSNNSTFFILSKEKKKKKQQMANSGKVTFVKENSNGISVSDCKQFISPCE